MITLEQGALVSLLLGALATLIARKWVPGWMYDDAIRRYEERLAEIEKDRAYWRDYALRVLTTAEIAVDKTGEAAATAIEVAKRTVDRGHR